MKVIYDTCIYIDFLRSSAHQEIFLSRQHVRFLSPVVMMELLAGVKTPHQGAELNKLFKRYAQASRILPMAHGEFYKSGQVLSSIRKKTGSLAKGFSHDVMIAVSAASIGAVLLTSNRKDFEIIKRYIPLRLEFLD